MTNEAATINKNNMLELIIHACVCEITESDAAREERDLLHSITDDARAIGQRREAFDIEKATWGFAIAVGEAMFRRGWELRGNPDLLAELYED
jgi:hypothetical protein